MSALRHIHRFSVLPGRQKIKTSAGVIHMDIPKRKKTQIKEIHVVFIKLKKIAIKRKWMKVKRKI